MGGVIYALVDPHNEEIRYVGKTTQGMKTRMREHKRDCLVNKHRNPLYDWMRSLDQDPKVITCETIPLEDKTIQEQRAALIDSEKWWIDEVRSMGFDLFNKISGGSGVHGFKMPRDAVERVADANRGQKRSPEAVENIRLGQSARDPSTYPCGEAHHQFGKPISQDHREALREGATRYNSDPVVKARQSEIMIGNNHATRKLTDAQVIDSYNAVGSHQSIANKFGVSRSLISQIKRAEKHVDLVSH
jgi:hypothetical protein